MERHGPRHAVVIVHRHPGVAVRGLALVGRDQRVPGHQPLRDAPIVKARIGIAPRADQQAAGRFENVEHGIGAARVFGAGGVPVQRIGIEIAAMQERDVARIDAALHRLQVIALLPALGDEALRRLEIDPFERRQRRLFGRRAHIGPDHAAELDARIGLELDLLAEAACGRLRGHLDALPGHVVFPAVIGAAQAVLLVAAEPQRHAAMGAEFVHQAEPALRVAKGDQPLAEQLHLHRRTVRPRQFLRHQCRDPVAAKQLAHRRAGAGAAQIFVLFVRDHVGSPELAADAGARDVEHSVMSRYSALPVLRVNSREAAHVCKSGNV